MTNLLIILNLFSKFRFYLYLIFLTIGMVKGLISPNIYYCDGMDVLDNSEIYVESSTNNNNEDIIYIGPSINPADINNPVYDEDISIIAAFGYNSDVNVTGEATIEEILSLYDRDDSDDDFDLLSESETVNNEDAMNYPDHPAYRNHVENKTCVVASANKNKSVRFKESIDTLIIKRSLHPHKKGLNWTGTRYTRTNFEKKYPSLFYNLKRKFFWKMWEKDRNNFNDYKEFSRGWDPRNNVFKLVVKEKSKDITTKVENLINSKNPFDIDRNVKTHVKPRVKR